METYELLLILNCDIAPDDTQKRDEIIGKMLDGQNTKITEIVSQGKKHLSYDIKKQKEGHFINIKFTASGFNIGQMEKQVKLMPQVLRYLLKA